jgi:hypothetical protein
LLAILIMVAAPGAASAQAGLGTDDEWYYRQPPTSLPQQLNGLLRPSTGETPRAQRIDSVRDVFLAVRSCWRLPAEDGPTGQQMTLRMSFKRSGEMLGRPRITYYEGAQNSDARKAFTNSIATALRACIPLPFSERLGAAVAGRPFTFRFVDDRRA